MLCCRIALGVSLFTTLVLALTVCLGVLQIKLNIFKVRHSISAGAICNMSFYNTLSTRLL
jgi:hypothetical protein